MKSLLSISELENYTFSIDKYQRGYRWGIREIQSLLNDVFLFDSGKESFYCLQPLVVRSKEGQTYELIDGQQRCTTIYLILKYLYNKDHYTLLYETRGNEDGTNVFLLHLQDYTFPDCKDVDESELDAFVSNYWKNTFIVKNTVEDTVDNFYFFKAYCIIKRWFDLDISRKEVLRSNLLWNTKIIWYEEDMSSNTSTSNSFINFNDGKISLDQAELIKGLFVLDINSIDDVTRKHYEENQFADEWNAIEHHLRVPEFWSFVHNDTTNRELANKITLLLQIEKGKETKSEDLFYTYREYEKDFTSNKKPEWRDLSNLYNQLEEWFSDRETYHLIGAVVHLTNESISAIVRNNKNEKSINKSELKNNLKRILRKQFLTSKGDFSEGYDLDKLKYGDRNVLALLLLHNIALTAVTEKYTKFPFNQFKEVKSWNIEHIYARNSDGFETIEDLLSWMEEIEHVLEKTPSLSSKLGYHDFRNSLEKIKVDDLKSSNNLIKNEIEPFLIEELDKDSLSNLCLLDNVTNIQVGKKIFRDKRDMILEINSELSAEAYIPIATKAVFQKSYTPSKEVVFNYWNTHDREAYIENMKKTILQFLEIA